MALADAQVVIAGSGHVADRLEALLRLSCRVRRVETTDPGPLVDFERALERASIATAARLYIVDDRDAANVQFVLAALKLRPDVAMTAALSNERLVPHLQQLHPNLVVVNPWDLVASAIVAALKEPAAGSVASAPAMPSHRIRRRTWIRDSSTLLSLAATFLAVIAAATIFFHRSERLDWITALYFVVTMGTTTGFGDISLRNSSATAKVVGMLTMISAIAFVSVFFSLLIDRIVARRTENLLGHRRHRLEGHVVVCGLGRVSYQVVQRLRAERFRVLVIEKDVDNRFLTAVRELGVPVMIADATVATNLLDAALDKASAVASLVNDDLVNLEVGLHARAIQPRIRVILRIFDRDTADELRRRIDIHYAISTSVIAAQSLLERSAVAAS